MIGQKLSPILDEIGDTLLEFTVQKLGPPGFTDKAFSSSCYIFFTVLMDKMWALQEKEDMPLKDRSEMATKAGEEFKKLIKVYTDIDTTKLY